MFKNPLIYDKMLMGGNMKDELRRGIILLIVVLLILAAVWITTDVLKGRLGNNTNASETTSSNDASFSNMIMLSKVFNIKDSEYKVLFYSNSNMTSALESTVKLYDSSNNDIKLYKINYDEAINSKVLGDSDNKDATSSSELKVKDVTLITIKDNKITSYITDYNEILSALE